MTSPSLKKLLLLTTVLLAVRGGVPEGVGALLGNDAVGVLVTVRVAVGVPVLAGVPVRVCVTGGDTDIVAVGVPDGLAPRETDADGEGVLLGVWEGVCVLLAVLLGLPVLDAVWLLDAVLVGVCVGVPLWVALAVYSQEAAFIHDAIRRNYSGKRAR